MEALLRYPGKVVIVTGGTSGIGLATVREFVRQGAKVVFCSKASEVEKGQAIQRELQASGCPGDSYFQVCDVRKESDIKRLIRVTVERYGCLDCLVNNAGDDHFQTTDDVTAQDFCNLMTLNAVSCLLASKYALPYLRETRGNIISMGSIVGILGKEDGASYVASKGAIIAMTKSLAIDESKYGFMGRAGTPEEVALGVLFLAADATFCTGLNLVLSGGAELGFGRKNQVGPEPEPSAGGNSQGSSSKEQDWKQERK